MVTSNVFADITCIRVRVKNNLKSEIKDSDLLGVLKHKIQLKELVKYYENDEDEDEKEDLHFFNPSHSPMSFMKFFYYIHNEMSENEENDLLLYHDLEPWRNTFVELVVEEDANVSDKIIVNDENIYIKTVTLKQLNDVETYYDIAANIFRLLKQYCKSLKYLKLRSPSDSVLNFDEEEVRLNFQNTMSETSNTYYQLTKAKYRINNSDVNIQIKSRQIKYRANLLILAGQYKSAMKLLDECTIQFYKNGDFLWLGNSLEMTIFVILNLAALSETNDDANFVTVPQCVDYLIDYDKHCICKDRIVKHHNTSKFANTKVNSRSGTPRNSTDVNSLKSNTSELPDENKFDKPKKHVIFPQALPLLVSNIYEKLIHYYEYTANEACNFITPILFNNTIIKYLNILYLALKTNDFNSWLEKITQITTNFDSNYLQPMESDLQFQLKKYDKVNLIGNLPISHALRWIQFQQTISKTVNIKRSFLFLVYNWLSNIAKEHNINNIKILNSTVVDCVFQLLLENIHNKKILKKLVLLLLSISQDKALNSQICRVGIENYEYFTTEEQKQIFAGIEKWPVNNKSLLLSFEVLPRDSSIALPLIDNQKESKDGDSLMKDEVFNPFRNKDYSRAEKLPVVEHVYIKNEVFCLRLNLFNYYNVELNLTDIQINNDISQCFQVVDFKTTTLKPNQHTFLTLNVKCLSDSFDDLREVADFCVQLDEFKGDMISLKELQKKKIDVFKILPEQPLLCSGSQMNSMLECDLINHCNHTLEIKSDIEFEVFDIELKFSNKDLNPFAFFNKMKINRAETQLYAYMTEQMKQCITASHKFLDKGDLMLNFDIDFVNFKIAPVKYAEIIVQYGILRGNVKYISSLRIPWNLEYSEKLIVTNLEIIPFNNIPSEQISLEGAEESDEYESKESWLEFIGKNHDFKWLLLLNIRNISSENITLVYKYSNLFESEGIKLNHERNRRVVIPIESSLFENKIANGNSIAFNILMNFNRLINIKYTSKKDSDAFYEMNLLSNIKLEDCYNFQKLVNRQDISIYLSEHEDILPQGQTATIVLEPGVNMSESKEQNILVSLMVIDTITGVDVLQDGKNTVLLNGMRTFNIDGSQHSVAVDCIFLVPGNYEINCLCEVGDDPSRVVKFFSTRAFNIRVI